MQKQASRTIYLVIEMSTDPDTEPDLIVFDSESGEAVRQYWKDNLCTNETHYTTNIVLSVY